MGQLSRLRVEQTSLSELGSGDLDAYETLLETTINTSDTRVSREIQSPLEVTKAGVQQPTSLLPGYSLTAFAEIVVDLESANPTNTSKQISHLPACGCFVHRSTNSTHDGTSHRATPFTSAQAAISTFSSSNISSWIAALDSGSRWNFTGTPTLTYSFFNGGTYYGSETGVAPLSAAARNSVRQIFNDIQALINVTFTEVADTQNSYGQIRLQLSNDPDYAYAYFPGSGSQLSGDVHLNPDYDNTNDQGWQGGIGSYGYETLIHEIGHALGLKHPGDYDGNDSGTPPFLTQSEDNNGNAVMSYNFTSPGASTFMPFDILALQSIYGARSLNVGDTTYTFTTLYSINDGSRTWGSATKASKLTLWDSNGLDTLNLSALSSNVSGYRFDLNSGGWLSRREGFNTATYQAYENPTGPSFNTTAQGIRLAYNSNIENLVGTSSNDEIYGNTLANSLVGGTGNDTISGDLGTDILVGGLGADSLLGEGDADILYGGDGVDILNGGQGDDAMDGEVGNDSLIGGDGNDYILGSMGNDTLKGETGFDVLFGGNDTIPYSVNSAATP
jgi:Ca2+-binding RTX toxin-like protein